MGKWTRRGFITAGVIGGSALVIGVALRPGNRNDEVAALVAQPGDTLVNIWVKIAGDNSVTVIVPHSEMGQGAQTVLAQMLADEMDANWEDVSIIEAPAHDSYANYALPYGFVFGDADVPKVLVGTLTGIFLQAAKAMNMQITGGSLSIRATGVFGMRVAGAAARQLLLEAASEAWGVPISQLRTDRGQIFTSDGRLAAPFSEFAVAAGEKTPPHTPTLKTPDQYRYMGKSLPRHDLPAKVDGSAVFGIDVMVPGMKVATINACPTFGGTLAGVILAESLPAGAQVVELDDAVAVVAGSYWEAQRALATVQPEWDLPEHSGLMQAEIYEAFEQAIAEGLDAGAFKSEVDVGDSGRVIAAAAQRIDVTYRAPYLAHACMEPMNATAHVVDDRCEIWVGTQNPLGTRHAVAEALDIPAANVIVHNHIMGGGFGRRSIYDATIQAAKISRSAGVPVKLIWSREEDMQHDFYRPAFSSRFQGVVSSSGIPTAWRNVFVNKSEPHEAPHIPYAIANISIGSIDLPMPIPEGPWRSVDSSQHAFFTESFIDELAHAAQTDPLEFRRSLLQEQPRYLAVLEALEQASDWHKPLESGRARGIALHESFGSIVGEVVQVNVTDQRLVVERVVCVADPGFAMSPDGFKAQMESGIIYGLTAALTGQVEISAAQAKVSNFHDYPVMRMKDSPVIDVIIINSGAPVGGAGEPGTPPAAPALTNAVFAATGQRIRELPLSLHGFKV